MIRYVALLRRAGAERDEVSLVASVRPSRRRELQTNRTEVRGGRLCRLSVRGRRVRFDRREEGEPRETPRREQRDGAPAHTRPPLHQAIAAGHLDVVKVLIDNGARLDITDTIHHGTPLRWAEYCNQPNIADFLRERGAPA